jgi:hypothetical protein
MSSASASARKRWLGFLVPCLALWVVSLAAAVGGALALTPALRIAGSVLVLAAWVLILKFGPRRLLLSPLTHLAAFALLFYGWFPKLSVLLMDWNPNEGIYSTRDNYDFIADYVGSRSELLVVGFAGLCLGAFAVAAAILSDDRRVRLPGLGDRFPSALGWTAIVGILCLMLVLAGSVNPQLGALSETSIGREVARAVPVIFPFLAAVLIGSLRPGQPGQLVLGLAVIIGGEFVLMLIHRAQMPLLIAYVLALFVTVSVVRSPRQLMAMGLAGVVFLSAMMIALVALRPPHDTMSPISETHRVLIMAEQKLLRRQGVSAGCYNKIAELGLSRNEAGNPFYFAAALVPRVLWPGKPNLSRGTEFAELCGETGASKDGHSESITLLGEPILEDGYRGLVVAELTLVVMLVALTVFALTGGPARMLWLVALLPWLIAVEQHFALYVASAFKMGLILLPAALALHWLLGRMAISIAGRDGDTARSARLGVG